VKRTCAWAGCGVEFETSSPRARFCSSTCRSRNSRAQNAPAPAPTAAKKPSVKKAAAAKVPTTAPKADEHAFVKATRRELVGLEALESMLGQQVLTIADRMGRGAETGSAMASLSKEHSRLMGELRARAKGKEEDPVEAARKAHADNVSRAQTG